MSGVQPERCPNEYTDYGLHDHFERCQLPKGHEGPCGHSTAVPAPICKVCGETCCSAHNPRAVPAPQLEQEICSACYQPYGVWFAANEIWNTVVPERVAMLCANCFIARAERQGFRCTAWQLVPENYEPAVPAPRDSEVAQSSAALSTREFYKEKTAHLSLRLSADQVVQLLEEWEAYHTQAQPQLEAVQLKLDRALEDVQIAQKLADESDADRDRIFAEWKQAEAEVVRLKEALTAIRDEEDLALRIKPEIGYCLSEDASRRMRDVLAELQTKETQ